LWGLLPTPVSALIHAATLVTAGVYLLVRLHIHDETFVILVGSLTAFMAGIFGAHQSDIKRVIAFSTCSQLGYPSIEVDSLDYLIMCPLTYCYAVMFCGKLVRTCSSYVNPPLPPLNQAQNDLVPTCYVELFTNLGGNTGGEVLYAIKKKYKKVAVIYLWYNLHNGKTYVGRTNNLSRRLENYLATSYITRTKDLMPICGALAKYGVGSFQLYILEVVDQDKLTGLPLREDYWITQVKPSYNLAAALDRFTGQNHPRYGKTVSTEVRNKISVTLTGRKLTDEHCLNLSKGQKKKTVYCYDFYTGSLVAQFDGIRPMRRELSIASNIQVYRKLDKNLPFTCVYRGVKVTWRLTTVPIVPT
jgi:group I intron endonuclease